MTDQHQGGLGTVTFLSLLMHVLQICSAVMNYIPDSTETIPCNALLYMVCVSVSAASLAPYNTETWAS